MNKILKYGFLLSLISFFIACGGSSSSDEVVNVYTHRHYKADDELFSKFTKETGIKVNIPGNHTNVAALGCLRALNEPGYLTQNGYHFVTLETLN